MNFPTQHHKRPLSEFAKRNGISLSTAKNIAKEFNATKTREQYEQDAQTRRKIAFDLRQQGLKFREIAEQLNISVNNAQQLVRRYQPTA